MSDRSVLNWCAWVHVKKWKKNIVTMSEHTYWKVCTNQRRVFFSHSQHVSMTCTKIFNFELIAARKHTRTYQNAHIILQLCVFRFTKCLSSEKLTIKKKKKKKWNRTTEKKEKLIEYHSVMSFFGYGTPKIKIKTNDRTNESKIKWKYCQSLLLTY